LPTLFIKPKYDFIYSYPDGYYSNGTYSVNGGVIIKHTATEPTRYQPPQEPKLFYYNNALNESREMPFEETGKLKLDPSSVSPDGFEIQFGRRNNWLFPLFFSGGYDYNSKYIVGHGFSKKLNLKSGNSYYYGDFKFLGWVLK